MVFCYSSMNGLRNHSSVWPEFSQNSVTKAKYKNKLDAKTDLSLYIGQGSDLKMQQEPALDDLSIRGIYRKHAG